MINLRDIFIALAVLTIVGVVSYWIGERHTGKVERRSDTVVVYDTVRDTVLVPVKVETVRVDTLRLQMAGDTVRVEVEVPIEQKVYKTDDYRAVVEGFRPNLVEMEIYRQTQVVTNTLSPRKKRWGLGVQVGYGAGVSHGKVVAVPYIGVGVSYNLIVF